MVEVKQRRYETVIVVDPQLRDQELEKEIDALQTLLERYGAKNVHFKYWGRKELGYEVKKERYGHYLCFEYEAEKGETPQLATEQLRLREEIMLFQTHRAHPKVIEFEGALRNERNAADRSGDRGNYSY